MNAKNTICFHEKTISCLQNRQKTAFLGKSKSDIKPLNDQIEWIEEIICRYNKKHNMTVQEALTQIQFDCMNGEAISCGWVLTNEYDKKLACISGEVNGVKNDNQINRADELMFNLFGVSLKEALSGRFNIRAEWFQI